MALLSDYEHFDKVAMQAVEDDALKDVLATAENHDVAGHLAIRESNREKLQLAQASAKRTAKTCKSAHVRSQFYGIAAAINTRMTALDNGIDWTKGE